MQTTFLEGNVGQVRPLRELTKTCVLNVGFAVTTYFGDKQYTTWYELAFWGDDARRYNGKFKSGQRLMVRGVVKAEAWVNKDGEAKSKLTMRPKSVGFVMKKPEAQKQAPPPPPAPPVQPPYDDIPF